MAGRSSIERLDPSVREVVDRLVRGGRTIDEIREHLEQMLGEEAPSRSAVGRYTQNARKAMQRYHEAQEIAKVWVGRLEEEPGGDVGRLLSEMLRTVAYRQIGDMADDEAETDSSEIMLLARAIKDLSSADKISADRELRVRREVATLAAKVAAKSAKAAGLSADAADEIRKQILGVAA